MIETSESAKMESSQKRVTYTNPIISHTRTCSVLDAIEEEDLTKAQAQAGAEIQSSKLSRSHADPFNQRVDSTGRGNNYYYKGYKAYSMPQRPHHSAKPADKSEGSAKTASFKSGSFSRSISKYLHKAKEALECDKHLRKGKDKLHSEMKKRERQERNCLGTTNKIVKFILMLLGILLILITLFTLGSLAHPAKVALIRVNHLLGESSIELHNVTIENTNLEGVRIPNLQDIMASIFTSEPQVPQIPNVSFDSLQQDSAAVMSEVEVEVGASSIIELKDATSNPLEEAFMSWCEKAKCTDSLRPVCPSLGRALDKGQRGGVPVIPFPREFCSAVRQLNKVGCLCDENIASIPGAERLSQSASLVATMCGFREELQTCE
jgi:hypothetical protein